MIAHGYVKRMAFQHSVPKVMLFFFASDGLVESLAMGNMDDQ